jgi:hypothetical protein
MFDWLRKKRTVSNGPDFSSIDSHAKAEAAARRGDLEPLFLLPPEFGGTEDPRNIVFVPIGIAAVKARMDTNIIRPLVDDGKVEEYRAEPEYQRRSFIPIAIKIVASSPGSFTATIKIWGKALERKGED